MKTSILITAALLLFFFVNYNADAQSKQFTVKNSSGLTITGVRVSHAGMNKWGFNLNVTGNIANNQSFQFKRKVAADNCLYDIRYKDTDGKYYFVKNVDLCLTTEIILPVPVEEEQEKK